MGYERNRALRRATLILTPFIVVILVTWNYVDQFLGGQQTTAMSLAWWLCYLVMLTVWIAVARQKEDPARVPTLTLAGLLVLQTTLLLALIMADQDSYNIRLFGAGLTIFGAAVCLPWSWKYTAAITLYTVTGFTVDSVLRNYTINEFNFAFFYLLSTASLSLASHYYQDRISWREFQTRIAASSARKDAEAARERNLQLKADLERISREDPLTGVANRRGLAEFLEREVAVAAESGTRLGLIMLDIDHFKKINDTYGHQAGDGILKDIATSLQQHLRPQDMLARYGGEEFVAVLPAIAAHEFAALSEKVRADARQPLPADSAADFMPHATLSAGAVLYPINGSDPDELMAMADEALYEAKESGRNRRMVAGGRGTVSAQPRTPIAPICHDDASDSLPAVTQRPISIHSYNEDITPQYRIFALWAAVIGFTVIAYWIVTEYFTEFGQFHEFKWARLIVETYLVVGWVVIKRKHYSYRTLLLWSFGAMCVIQAQLAWLLPRLNEDLQVAFLAVGVTIFAAAISLPWHWKYSVYTTVMTGIAIIGFNSIVTPGLSRSELTQLAFILFTSGAFATFGHYIRFRTSWDEYVAKRSIEKASAQADAQRQASANIVAQLARLTREDSLTHIANRRAFNEHLDERVAGIQPAGNSFGLVMLDIDHFKKLNDTHGHQVGDAALYYVAQALQSRLATDDFLARYGGEEFVVLLADTGPGNLAERAEHIRHDIAAAITDATIEAGIIAGITLSAGAALCPTHGQNADQLIQAADACLYEAKTHGRNQTRCAQLPNLPQQRTQERADAVTPGRRHN